MVRRYMQRSPKLSKRWNATKMLQLGLYIAWPVAVLWVLVGGPEVYVRNQGAFRIKQTYAEEEILSFSLPRTTHESEVTVKDVQLKLEFATTSSAQKNLSVDSSTQSSDDARVDDSTDMSEQQPLHSSMKVYASHGTLGRASKYYYSLRNVRLTRNKLQFFASEDFKYPNQSNWVDIVTGNATSPQAPTMLVIKGEAKNTAWYYLPIKYFHSPAGPENCKGWIDKPAYFLQVRYSYNIWHTWNEGLMGAFQTLREQGMLPLVQVDAEGNMREVWEGAGHHRCPLVYDPVTNKSRPEETCLPLSGAVSQRHCDNKNQRWCRPGVWSYNREDGPLILSYTPSSVMNQWAQIYGAMSQDVRDFSQLEGYCFRNIIIGKTSTLNFYQMLNGTKAPDVVEERAEAMSVFKAFVATAQQEWVRKQAAKKPSAAWYKGYKDKALERLRKGIGPEDIDLVDSIMPTEVPGLVVDEAPVLAKLWEKKLKAMAEEQREKELAAMLEQLDNKVGGQAVEGENGVANEADSDSAGGDGQSTDRALVGLQEDSGNDDAGQEGGGSDHSSGESGEAGADGGTNPSESEAARAGAGSDPSSAEAARADVASGTDGSGAKVDSSTASESASAETESQQQQQAQKGAEEEGQRGALRLRRLLAVEADQGVGRGRLLQKEEMAGGQLNLDQGASTSESLLGGASHAAAHRHTSHVAEMGGMAAGAVDAAVLDEIDADGTADTMELSDSWERAVQNMPPVVHKAPLPLERPRPVVTYMIRNFFSRRVLNDHSLLRYILSRYNVTVRVTTLEEPLQIVIDTLQHTDVLIGMHGAGWTNALFIKHGATAVQLYPYGWQLPSGRAIRGHNYRELVLANKGNYLEWFNPHAHYAFMRREDVPRQERAEQFQLQFDPADPPPTDGWPGNKWIYQNTYVDMGSLGPVIDEAMRRAGVQAMEHPVQEQPKQASLVTRTPTQGGQQQEQQGEDLPAQQAQQQQGEDLPAQQAQQQQQGEDLPAQQAQQQQGEDLPVQQAQQQQGEDLPVQQAQQQQGEDLPAQQAQQQQGEDLPAQQAQQQQGEDLPSQHDGEGQQQEQQQRRGEGLQAAHGEHQPQE